MTMEAIINILETIIIILQTYIIILEAIIKVCPEKPKNTSTDRILKGNVFRYGYFLKD
jgi:hypothetical protein